MLTIALLLLLSALVVTIASTWTPPKAPLWVAVLLLIIAGLLQSLPIRQP
jgi:hypothetical protein